MKPGYRLGMLVAVLAGGQVSNIRFFKQLEFPLINQHQTLQVDTSYQDTNED